MEKYEIQQFSSKNNLDVREIQFNHWRLLDEYGDFVLDVYFKQNKRGEIIKNSVLQWKTKKWFYPIDLEQLEKLLTV